MGVAKAQKSSFGGHFDQKSTSNPQKIKKTMNQKTTFSSHLDLHRAQNRDFYVFDFVRPIYLW